MANDTLQAFQFGRMVAQNKEIDALDDNVAALKARIAELELEAMRAAGLEAQVKALLAQHPDSPLRADSGKLYKDGTAKKKIGVIYQDAFDAKGRAMGIANPAARRAD